MGWLLLIWVWLFLVIFTWSYFRVHGLGHRKYFGYIVLFAPVMLIMGVFARARSRNE
jgi:hypothetical protein